ncbi:MAG: PD40 domain-containing protein [Gemmatimonadota bacterium]|nr:MAG: PD40 domain-containing protein [Gemmatimonadota bacterium]
MRTRVFLSNSFVILFIACALIIAWSLPQRVQGQYYFGKNKIQYSQFDWHVIQTQHFHIYFYSEEKPLAETVAAWAEKHYRELERKVAHHIFKPIPLILYSAPSYFQQTNTIPYLLPEGVGGFFEYMKGRVVIPSHGSWPHLNQILRHELVHVFMHHKIDATLRQHRKIVSFSAPLWFTEGLAEYWSQGWNTEADMFIRDAVLTGRLVPLQEMHRIFGTYKMYKQGQSVVKFIAETYGQESITLLLENWPKAKNFDRLLQLTLGTSLKELNDAWTYTLKKRYFPIMKDKEPAEMIAFRLTDGIGINVRPVVVPNPDVSGDQEDIIFLGNTTGYSDIYRLRQKDDEKKPQEIVKGGRSAKFESFHLFRTKLSVSRDGLLAFVSKHKERDALYIWNLDQNRVTARYQWPELIALSSPTWSPRGDRLAFSGIDKGGTADLYVFDRSSGHLRRVTHDIYDDRDPDWSPDGDHLVFSSDRGAYGQEGFYNLYLLSLEGRAVKHRLAVGSGPVPNGPDESLRPTPLTAGKHNDYAPAWSPDGQHIAYSSDREGIFNIYITDRRSRFRCVTNTFGGAFDPDWTSDGRHIIFSGFEEYQFHLYRLEIPEQSNSPVPQTAALDTTGWEPPRLSTQVTRGPLTYRKKFTLDIAQSAFAFSPGWGSFGGVQVAFSDMLGNHHYYFLLANTAEASQEFLERFNFGATYLNLTHRFNYGYGAFHLANDYYNDFDGWYFQRDYGVFGAVTYPLTKFERIESSLQIKKSDRNYSFYLKRRKALLASNYISYVRDTSLWGPVGPLDGMRCNITLGTTTNITQRENHNISFLTDIRKYFRLSQRTSYALRLVGYYSGGDEPLRFYLGGSWSLRGYSFRHFLGRKLVLMNNEFRFPLIDYLRAGLPFLSFGLQSIRGAFFFDVGNAWEKNYDGLYGSFGLGARMRVAGFLVLRFDVAKTTDFHTVSHRPSVQFFFGWDY